MEEAKWYVIHTYSGYENKVKADIEKNATNRGMTDLIQEVFVPMEDVVEVKNGVRKQVQRKSMPGYVLVKMVHTAETWFVVRNTRGVTGFVGPDSDPTELSELEMRKLGIFDEDAVVNIEIDFEEGDMVRVISGAWKDMAGNISSINHNKQTVTISLDMFGRSTPVELNFLEVEKI